MFSTRKEAASLLAKALKKYNGKEVIVLGIPRGGAEAAYYVAKYLEAELSLLICRKLARPRDPGYVFGALAEDGTIHLCEDVSVSQEMIDDVTDQQTKEIQRKIRSLRKGKPLPGIKNKTVILVDDDIVTGAAILAAIKMCRNHHAGRVIVAVLVSSAQKEKEMLKVADEVFILEELPFFTAIPQGNDSIYNLTDKEAAAFLEKWEKEREEK